MDQGGAMSPLGLLLLSRCDNNLRIDLDNINFFLSVLGISQEKATYVANYFGLTVHRLLN